MRGGSYMGMDCQIQFTGKRELKKTRRPERSAGGRPTRRGGYRDALMAALL